MLQPTPANSSQMTLPEVIDRVAQNEIVDGIFIIGSAGKDKLTPASDYDLVIVLAETPLPLHVGVTYIDHRFTDLIFLTTKQIEQVLTLATPLAGDEWLGKIVRWLQTGTLTFDRKGQMAQAQKKVKQGQWVTTPDETDGYGPWFRLNYNLAQSKRMLASDDPVYLMAVDLRVALYGPADLLFSYFTLRQLLWEGEKEAVRYLMAHDPAYLDLFREFIFEADRLRKFALYETLAKTTVAPLGTIWPDNISVMAFDQKVTLEIIEKASDFWDGLIGITHQS